MDEIIFEKWNKTRLLEKVKDKKTKRIIAQILENQYLFNAKIKEEGEQVKINISLFKRLSIPLINRILVNFPLYDVIGFNALSMPTGNIKYRDIKNNITREMEVVAKTRWLTTRWDQNLYEELRKTCMYGLDAEADVTAQLYENISLEIQKEILKDLANNIPHNVNLHWKNVNTFVDTVLITSSSVEKRVGKSANWIIVPFEIFQELKESADFNTSTDIASDLFSEVYNADSKMVKKVGKLCNKWDVYVDPNVENLDVLVGYKGEDDAGYFYCPYIMLSGVTESNTVDTGIHGMFMRYGKKLIDKNYYSKIIISGYSIKK